MTSPPRTARYASGRPVYRHLQQLLDAGWTSPEIARVTGHDEQLIADLADPEHPPLIGRRLSDSILRLAGAPARVIVVDAVGSCRRVRALAVMGHDEHTIATAAQVSTDAIVSIASGRRGEVTAVTARRISHAYRRLCRIPGASPEVQDAALALGWRGPAAWGSSIDDAQASADLTPAEQRRRVAWLAEQALALEARGYHRPHIAQQLGVDTGVLYDAIRRYRKRRPAKAAA